MDPERYLQRIRYTRDRAPGARNLRRLQLAHLLTVPFENLSIHAGEPIVLNDDALYEKIVLRRRGGFCYELNGLFCALLRALGFEVVKLSAGVADGRGAFSPPFDHMTLKVALHENWLVDVGFGDTFRQPLSLDTEAVQEQDGRAYRITPDGDRRVLWERKDGAAWQPQYRFTLQPCDYPDYAEMCHHNQTSPASHFTQGRVCSRATKGGRLSLSENRFIRTALDGGRQEQAIESEEAFTRILQREFGIVM